MPSGMFELVQSVEPGLETDGYPPSDLLFNDPSLLSDDPANWYAVREYASGLGDHCPTGYGTDPSFGAPDPPAAGTCYRIPVGGEACPSPGSFISPRGTCEASMISDGGWFFPGGLTLGNPPPPSPQQSPAQEYTCSPGDTYYQGGCYNPQEWAAITGPRGMASSGGFSLSNIFSAVGGAGTALAIVVLVLLVSGGRRR